MFVVSSFDWGNAVTGLRWWLYLPNDMAGGLCVSSPFGQTGANAEQACWKFFSATSLSQDSTVQFVPHTAHPTKYVARP
jgi:hypothetical protein